MDNTLTTENNTEISVNGLADTLDRIAEGVLRISGHGDVVGTALENVLNDLYEVITDEAANLRGENDDED